MIALKCKVCSTYSSNTENIKNFSHTWAFEGSVNLRVSNAMDHAKGSLHKSAIELYWKNSSISEEEKAEKLRDNQQHSIVPGIASMQAADHEKTKKMFDLAYLIAKEELPMTKYAAIIDLEKKHGVDLGITYCNEMQAATFMTNIVGLQYAILLQILRIE